MARSSRLLGAHEWFLCLCVCTQAVFPPAGPWGRDVWETQATRALWVWSLLRGPSAAPGPLRPVPTPSASAPARSVPAASGARRTGGGREMSLSWRAWPGSRLPAGSPGLSPTCSVGGAWPWLWAWPAGPGRARRSLGDSGRLLIPGIPRAPALASAAEPARRARSACACGCAEGASVRERGRERACASVRPGVRPARSEVPPPPPRGPAGPRRARPQPLGGECWVTGPAGWRDPGRVRGGLRGSAGLG